MQLSLLLAVQIASMVLMILAGYGIAKSGILPADAGKALSAVVMFVLCPCLVFNAFHMDFSREKLYGLLIGLTAAILVHVLYIPLSIVVAKVTGCDNLDRASMIYSNAGNLIVPLLSAVLGSEYVFYSSGYLAVQTLLIWVHCIRLASSSAKIRLRRVLTNPSIIAMAVGMLFFFLSAGLPGILSNTVEKLGVCVGPMSMIGIGIIMSQMNLRSMFGDKKAWLLCILRLLVFPFIFILLVWVSHVAVIFPLAGKVLVATILAAAGPTAVSISQLAEVYGGDAARAGRVNVMSTLFCVITMPVMIYIYQILCL